MAKVAGRKSALLKNAVAIGGIRNITVSGSAGPIDVTDKDSLGLTTLLSGAGDWAERQITISVDGVYTDPVLRNLMIDPAVEVYLTDLTFTFGSALAAKDTISGNFFMTSYEEGADYKDAATFSATFVSSGTWTFA